MLSAYVPFAKDVNEVPRYISQVYNFAHNSEYSYEFRVQYKIKQEFSANCLLCKIYKKN